MNLARQGNSVNLVHLVLKCIVNMLYCFFLFHSCVTLHSLLSFLLLLYFTFLVVRWPVVCDYFGMVGSGTDCGCGNPIECGQPDL